jgi:hypothetical protein
MGIPSKMPALAKASLGIGRAGRTAGGTPLSSPPPPRRLRVTADDPRPVPFDSLPAPAADMFNQKVEGTAWRSKPSWYIVDTKDRIAQP